MNLVSKLTKPAKNVLVCQLALCVHEPKCLGAYALTCQRASHAYGSRANVPCVLRCTRANVPCVLRCQRAYVLMCKRAMLSNVNYI